MTEDELVERLFGAALGAIELFSVHLGWRLGLYRTLAESDAPMAVAEFATRAGIDERYAREWLEQQAAAGFVAVDIDSGGGRYSLPDGHHGPLVDGESLAHVAPFAPMLVGVAGALPEVVDAYRTGAGVPYTRYGNDFRDGQGAINRPAYHHLLGGWIAEGMPDIDARLREPGAVAVDLGCGQGWSTIALARAYPDAEVVGVDTDQASIDDAIANAAAAGAGTGLRFVTEVESSGTSAPALVCIFEALHDMAAPVDVLRSAKDALADGGALLVVDERVGDAFTGPTDEVERVMYGWSVVHCLPACRVETPSAALGTVLRRPMVRELASAAGFAEVDELEIENDFFRFYRFRPY